MITQLLCVLQVRCLSRHIFLLPLLLFLFPLPEVHAQEEFELIDIDTLFYVDNSGLSRIIAELNGNTFKFASDPAEVAQSSNAFLIPEFGDITFNIADFIIKGVDNYITITSQGPAETDAFILIGDLFVPGQSEALKLTGLPELPEALALNQNYPNPFQSQTSITFEVPEQRITGVSVSISIYDALGRLIRRLTEDHYFPGRFTVTWDGRSDDRTPVAGGVYLGQLVSGQSVKTIKIVRRP